MPEATRKAVDVQEAALKAVSDEAFHGAIDGKTRELAILPRVCWLVVKGSAVRVKVNALLCLSKTFHFFQVRAVVDKVSCCKWYLTASSPCCRRHQVSVVSFYVHIVFSAPLREYSERLVAFATLGISRYLYSSMRVTNPTEAYRARV